MKKQNIMFIFSLLLSIILLCSCSNQTTTKKPDYSFLNEVYNDNTANNTSQSTAHNSEEVTASSESTTNSEQTHNSSESAANSDQANMSEPSSSISTGNISDTETANNIEWPYELDFDGVNTDPLKEVKTGNLRTNYKFFSEISCLFCPDMENDILYYVNYDKDNYIYQLKDDNISLLVDMPAFCLQLWDNKLYFISFNDNNVNTIFKTGDIYCFDINSKKVELIQQTDAFSLVVDSYGIFYQTYDNGLEAYRIEFDSNTPQKVEDYFFYFPYNEYMIINDINDPINIYICNIETGEKTFLVPISYAQYQYLLFAEDYMVFSLNRLVYVLNLRTGKKDIYDIESMTGTFAAPVDYFLINNILYMVNTNRFLALDLSNGKLVFPSRYITYDEQINSWYVFAGKEHYYTVYNTKMFTLGNYLINERDLSNGKLTKELNQ